MEEHTRGSGGAGQGEGVPGGGGATGPGGRAAHGAGEADASAGPGGSREGASDAGSAPGGAGRREPGGDRTGSTESGADRGEGDRGEGPRGRGRGWGSPLSEIQDVVGDLVDTALRGFGSTGGRFPRHDLVQVPGEGYRVLMDLPGVAKEALEVSTVGDELVVAGERKRPELPEGSEVLRSERGYGRFRRAVRLPADVDPAGVEARLEEGVLHLTLPLRTGSQKVRVDVE